MCCETLLFKEESPCVLIADNTFTSLSFNISIKPIIYDHFIHNIEKIPMSNLRPNIALILHTFYYL